MKSFVPACMIPSRKRAKITAAQVREIRSWLKLGWKGSDLDEAFAAELGLGQTTIRDIRTYQTWSHVKCT